MSDDIDELLIEVRASTQGFARDIAVLRGEIDTGLGEGFARAGDRFERSLTGAIRRGSLGFEDLKNAAFSAFDAIAAQGMATLVGAVSGGNGAGGGLAGLVPGLLGLPGRATGGNVAPGQGYLVGERGPEVFVPTSAGRIETAENRQPPRDVRVAISLGGERGASAPRALQRSSRQIASSVRRALTAS
ncbi:tail tape measure protein [Novosphingobium decolorationis]|uniref:Tail tape measure protein n=1 Tax=Novosphingobium decolorationis TaxID=2698673 RepID=A0ABX8E7X1_9SPHN|nr:tail tape measure protein [Novosphingobium decolorationis]MED5543731.1 tail tape measure protein [Pseudomonadota bacterium]QVM84938.1 tail tape measure protein [Novosphingobium decolorationis]